MKQLAAFLLLLCIDLSSQKSCNVEIYSPPYTDCQNERWGPVSLLFEPKGKKFTFPMSTVCKKGGIASFSVDVSDLKWVRKGFLKLLQQDTGPKMAPKIASSWFIEWINITCSSNAKATFGLGRHIETSRLYDFTNFDTTFKHDTCARDQNLQEMSLNRYDYGRTPLTNDSIYVVKSIDKENMFEFGIITKVQEAPTNVMKAIFMQKYADMKSNPFFTSFYEIEHYYDGTPLPEREVIKFWKEDSWFAAQRLQGADPEIVKSIHKIPREFRLNRRRAEKIMGERLRHVLRSRRMYIADLDVLDVEGMYAPMALFFVDYKGEFRPLAIQLTRTATPDQVFYPDDNENAWLLAKIYYNGGETLHHQLESHLGHTHLVMDAVGVLMYQNFPPSHPIFKLLKPHLYETFGTNANGALVLLTESGLFAKAGTGGVAVASKIEEKVVNSYDYNRLNPARDERYRKTGTIKTYPYRDRTRPIFRVIRSYVHDILKNYYNGLTVYADEHLRNFRIALAQPASCQGGGIKNLPGNDRNGLISLHELTTMLATFIWRASANHAAVHKGQYFQYAFHPNYPMKINKPPPTTKNITENYILQCLPNKLEAFTVVQMAYVFLFDGVGGHIGQFDRQFLYSPKDLAAIKRFNERLDVLSKKKYASLQYPYTLQDIDSIRNSIRN